MERISATADKDHPDTGILARLAYDHAVRGLDSQIAVLGEARTRANQLVVASVAVATLFGGFLFREPAPPRGVGIAAIVPLALLAGGMVLAIRAWRPTGKQGARAGELQLVASARLVLDQDLSDGADPESVVAVGLEDMWDGNQLVIERLMALLRRASTCLAGQVASWTLLLILKQVF
jgi:hypothetical protein